MDEYPGINSPKTIIIHHTADDALYQAKKIDDVHRYERENPKSLLGFYGGYQYLIEKSGLVVVYRLETEGGAHTKGQNFSSVGIALAGNFNEKLPTMEQQTALVALLDGVMGRWKIPAERIVPHRWFVNKDCPGTLLTDNWAQVLYLKHKLNWLQRMLLWLQQNLPQ